MSAASSKPAQMDKENNNNNGGSGGGGVVANVDSDDSERWEDFFGSSTDISPSVIEYYDRLSQNIDHKPQTLAVTAATTCPSTTTTTITTTANNITTAAATSAAAALNGAASTTAASCAVVVSRQSVHQTTQPAQVHQSSRQPQQRHTNIRDNITGASTVVVSEPSKAAQSAKLQTNGDRLRSTAFIALERSSLRASSPKKTFTVLSHNVARMLAQSSRENLSDSTNEAVAAANAQATATATAASRSGSPLPPSMAAAANAKRTTTATATKYHHTNMPLSRNTIKLTQLNGVMPSFEPDMPSRSSSSDSIVTTVHDKDANTCSGYFGSDATVSDSDKTVTSADVADAPKAVGNGGGKGDHRDDNDDDGDSSDEHFEDCITEAINFMVQVPEAYQAQKVRAQRKLCTIQERKNMLYPRHPSAKPPLERLPEGSSTHSTSTKTTTTATSVQTAIRTSPKLTKAVRKVTPPPVLVARPLSVSSISSTTSSSSSGSEHHHHHLMAGQKLINGLYLASVESLADQSESEQMAGGGQLLTMCERTCREIVDSERSYVKDLGQVIKGYLEDWKERACLDHNQLRVLFSNIVEVYAFNGALLKQLVEADNDPVKIAQCFIDQYAQFDAYYTVYCTSYPEATSLLTVLLQASHTNALLTSTQKMLRHDLPLGSYLLKPVQRILKYHLLLENLRKYSDCNVVVSRAHGLMKGVARNIDQVKRNLEQLSRVKELSGVLDGWLGPSLTVLGELILDGLLMENSKPRTVLLFQQMLIITKKKEDNRLQFKSFIHANNLMLTEHLTGEPTSFTVIPFNDQNPVQIKLTARNRNEKRDWATHIKQVMLAQFDIPNRAKELVFQLGDEEDRRPLDKNTWWNNTTSSSSTPDYLQRRNETRRSEIRSKKKMRKPALTATVSMDIAGAKTLHRNGCGDNHRTGEPCNCALVHQQLNEAISAKQKQARSRFDPPHLSAGAAYPLSLTAAAASSRSSDDAVSLKSTAGICGSVSSLARKPSHGSAQLLEVKMYNTKTLPKRIATLKKQRAKTACGPAKETFKFYMDFRPEEETTVLRITESIEDLSDTAEKQKQVQEQQEEATKTAPDTTDAVQPPPKPLITKNDVAIISDLLSEKHRQFDRILKKPPKKLPVELPRRASSGALLPLSSPPHFTARSQSFEEPSRRPPDEYRFAAEPIYESLLRNVHVPYKFSPILSRSISQHHYRFTTRAASEKPTTAPVSDDEGEDYVTLEYSEENGALQRVDGETVPVRRFASHVSASIAQQDVFHSSDSNINYNRTTPTTGTVQTAAIAATAPSDVPDSMPSLNSSLSSLQITPSKSAGTHALRKSRSGTDTNSRFGRRSSKPSPSPPAFTLIHRQGSEALGSRIAHMDYADPRTLFTFQRQSSSSLSTSTSTMTSSSQQLLQQPSGSLASSIDSFHTANSASQPQLHNGPSLYAASLGGNDSFYEQSVEDLLETVHFAATTDIGSMMSTTMDDGGQQSAASSRDSAVYSGDEQTLLQRGAANDATAGATVEGLVESPRSEQKPELPRKPAALCRPPPTPPPLPAKERTSWVLRQIKNFDK